MSRFNGLRPDQDVGPLVHSLLDSLNLGHSGREIVKQSGCGAHLPLPEGVCGGETYLHED